MTAPSTQVEVIEKPILEKVRGLSLTRPWPWAFVNGPVPKRIENRSWPPPRSIMGSHWIALHAAKSWDEDDREFIEDITGIAVPPRDHHPHSVIFAVCRVPVYVHSNQTAFTDNVLEGRQRRWFFGPYGWVIRDFVALVQLVACKGAQGLWGFDNKQAELAELRRVYRLTLEQRLNAF